MKNILTLLMIGCIALAASQRAKAQVTVGVDSSANWLGYMNVSELLVNGGAFVFGSPWGTEDLTAVFSGSTLTLGPNTIEDPNEFWYQCTGGATPPNCGGPGAPGNKLMEANMYVEETDTFAGQTVTFEGSVISNTLTFEHETIAFIKDFAPDYSSFNIEIAFLDSPGPFSLSLATDPGLGRHVQYGFATTGPNVWATDVAPFGTVEIAATSSQAPGDFDNDGDVDGRDFIEWQRGNSPNGTPGGAVSADDLVEWQGAYPALTASVGAVPEPSSCILAMFLTAGIAGLRRR